MFNRFFLLFILLIGISVICPKNAYSGEKERKAFKKKVFISLDMMRARMETSLTFESSKDVLSVKIGLERNLGLETTKFFSHGSILWRITPRSGLFGSYYRIYRSRTAIPNQDIPYLDKLIPAGTPIKLYFNTNVTSVGYIFTLVSDKKSFLGAYVNTYLMNLRTGISSDGVILNEDISFIAPLPNFGVLMIFDVTSWLTLKGNFGYFYLAIDEFNGKITEVNIASEFKIYKWLGVSLSYKSFDLALDFKTSGIKSTAAYNFQGPGLGINLKF